MPKVAVVTDSVACIPESMIKTLNIHWVAYYIHRGQEVLRDLLTVQSEEFLKWLETATVLPTTASPGPGDYVKQYQELAENEGVKDIVSIHITSKGSGAYQAMVDRIESTIGPNGKIKIAYVHAAALSEVQKIRNMVVERLTVVESLIAELSPALAVHSGPGTTGVCYFPVET